MVHQRGVLYRIGNTAVSSQQMEALYGMRLYDLKFVGRQLAGFPEDSGGKHEFSDIVKQSAGGCHHLVCLGKVEPAREHVGNQGDIYAVIADRVLGIVHIEEHVKDADILLVLAQQGHSLLQQLVCTERFAAVQ